MGTKKKRGPMRRYKIVSGSYEDEGGWRYRAGEKGNDVIETDVPLTENFKNMFVDLGPVEPEEEEQPRTSRRRKPAPPPEEPSEASEEAEDEADEAGNGDGESSEGPDAGEEEGSEPPTGSLKPNEEARAVHKGRGRWEVEIVRDGVPTGETVNEEFLPKAEAMEMVEALNASKPKKKKED